MKKTLLGGVRIYIAIAIGLITLQTIWWSAAAYGSTTLAVIRIQEVYGWVSLLFLVVAISIGPVYKLFPKLKAKFLFYDARRLIGIGAAWFGFLHTAINYFGLFGAPNPLDITGKYG